MRLLLRNFFVNLAIHRPTCTHSSLGLENTFCGFGTSRCIYYQVKKAHLSYVTILKLKNIFCRSGQTQTTMWLFTLKIKKHTFFRSVQMYKLITYSSLNSISSGNSIQSLLSGPSPESDIADTLQHNTHKTTLTFNFNHYKKTTANLISMLLFTMNMVS